MSRIAQRIVEAGSFRAAITAVILFAGVLAGVETSAAIQAQHGALLHALDAAVLVIFVIEIALKLLAHGRRPLDFFRDGWNVFDFSIVVLCLLPVGGPFAAVLRLVRALRVLRLITALPKLQLLVGALLKSLGAMGYVGLLLALMFYIYAVTGIHLFGTQSPQYFGSLPVALVSLFQVITLDNWSDLLSATQRAAPVAATAYFVTFILLGTMIMLNLFIGIVMNSMSEMHVEMDGQRQSARAQSEAGSVLGDLSALGRQLEALRTQVESVRARVASEPSGGPSPTGAKGIRD